MKLYFFKNLLLITLLLTFGAIKVLAQSPCHTTANGITTNPDAPVNAQCSGTMLNTFDWRQQFYPMYAPSEIPGITQVTSPFHNTSNINLEDLWNQTVK